MGVEIHRHHIIPRSEGGGDDPKNIELLCVPCHKKHHSDNMSRDIQGKHSDISGKTSDIQGKPSDIAVSPEPLIKPLINKPLKEPSLIKEEDNNNNQPFGLLMDAFISESNIPSFGINPRDVEAGQRMVQAGVTEADVIKAVQVLQENGYNMVGLASVEKTSYNEVGKRKNKGDKDRSSDKARSKYAEGWK